MSPEDIQAMAKGLAEGQAIWYVLSAVIGGSITGVTAYVAEKFKNRATKEDIRAITEAAEAVKDDFNKQLENLRAHHQLRMVAAERRMQAHQDGYIHWVILHTKYEQLQDDQDWLKAYGAAFDWFNQNKFFLGTKSRDVLSKSFTAMNEIRTLKGSVEPEMRRHRSVAYGEVEEAPHVLLEEVELPPLRLGVIATPLGMADTHYPRNTPGHGSKETC